MQVLVLGAGQLARMMSLAGAPLNIQVSAYDIGSESVVHPLTQMPVANDKVAGNDLESAIRQADVITAEFEHIPPDILAICEQSGKFRPSARAIKAGGDRRIEKQLLDDVGVKNARYCVIQSYKDFQKAIEQVGIPMVLKSALGGYDGKGQWRLTAPDQADALWAELSQCIGATENQAMVAEELIPFGREVSLVGARSVDGTVAVYPLAENVHTRGVLGLSTAIRDEALQAQAKQVFRAVAERLDYVGVLALEFFDVDGTLLVNELAPRVHNSGHWTQQGSETCQFENHLRAICGMPLGSTRLIRATTMINILGEDRLPEAVMAMEGVHVHWYGKGKRPGRKMGHINVCGDDADSVQRKLCALAKWLGPSAYPVLHASG